MKLSEAILLGSVGSEQGFGRMVDGNKACAAGAALIAIGISQIGIKWDTNDTRQHLAHITYQWPWTTKYIKCPHSYELNLDCGGFANIAHILSWHLNDNHRWTRPQIAKWVEGLEAIYDTQPEVIKVDEKELVS